MSEAHAANVAPSQSPLTRAEAESYLREHAPVAIGDGPDAVKLAAARIARKIGPAFKSHRGFEILPFEVHSMFRAMRDHWLPRCDPPLDLDDLEEIIEEARREWQAGADAAKAKEAARLEVVHARQREARQQEAAAAEAAEAKRTANATYVKELAAKLDRTPQHARQLLKGKTTLPEVAEKIAEVLGTDPSQHLRRKARSGRRPNLIACLLRPYVAGASWSDFIENPPELEGVALELRDAFAAAYKSGRLGEEHFKELEPISTFAHSVGIDADVAVDLWNVYKRWRIEQFMAAALDEVADPFDFG